MVCGARHVGFQRIFAQSQEPTLAKRDQEESTCRIISPGLLMRAMEVASPQRARGSMMMHEWMEGDACVTQRDANRTSYGGFRK